ncbi:MAG TPA: hypothetical protein VGM27_25655, partial [Acidobacteriaceae bacterium]
SHVTDHADRCQIVLHDGLCLCGFVLLGQETALKRRFSGTSSGTDISSPQLWQTPLNYGPGWI